MRRFLPIATLLAALSLAGAAADPAGAASPRGSHVFVIVMENHEYGEVIGSGQAPFLNRLAKRYGSATRMYAISHPSLPNYLAMLGGSTFGISSDCIDCDGIPGRTLTGQLDAKRIGWQAFMEGMPSACFRGAGAGGYAKKHNPFAYFRESYGAGACRNVLPASRLGGLLGSSRLAEFNWITPDLCNDTHDCGVGVGDRHLARLVPRLLARTGPKGFVVVTYDEGSSSAGCCGHAHGGHIATVIAGPPVQRGAVSRPYTLYSLLRTIEDVFGVGHLRMAGCACTEPMDKLFKGGRAPRIGSGGGPAPDPGDGGGIDHTVPTAALLRDEADGSRAVRFRLVDEGSGIDPSSLLAEASRDDGPWLALDGAAFDAATGALGGDLPAILGEGTIRVRLTARDLAGNALRYGFDDLVTLTVDLTAPAPVALHGDQVLRRNEFTLSWEPATEQPSVAHLRLCAEADAARCSEVTAEVAAGQMSLERLALPAEGRYTVRLWLEDLYGNANPTAASNPIRLVYDATAPRGAFSPPRERELSLHLRDPGEGSGLVSCRIEAQLQGRATFEPVDQPGFDAVGGDCHGRLGDSRFAPGAYALRATATDVAGNETTISTLAGGGPAQTFVRYPTRMTVETPAVAIAFGATASIACRLEDSRGPVAGAEVEVTVRTDLPDAPELTRRALSDPAGRVEVTLPAGPSRAIGCGYGGDAERRGSEAGGGVRTLAATSHAWQRDGRLKGQLLGREGTPSGTAVGLEVARGGAWRRIAQARAGSGGAWALRPSRLPSWARRGRLSLDPGPGYPYAASGSREFPLPRH